jgi:excisionase family DNA binding protein
MPIHLKRITKALERIADHLDRAKPPAPLTAEQVAERLGCSAEKVYKLARTGQLNCSRVGRLYRFTADDIAKYQAGADKTKRPLRLIA